MAKSMQITPCLWFDDQAEEAVKLYCSIFSDSRVTGVTRYGEAGKEVHQKKPGSVMALEFELNGQPFMALNGGPMFQFSEAISFQIFCDTQEEVDAYWSRLTEGADPNAQQCGWLKDRYGVSWQVVPRAPIAMMKDPDAERVRRTSEAMFAMTKLNIAELQRAFDGPP
jgi:predicted 3-demethylubiquinone-9 3-methyltransferase (glyoxalase superfamily)